MTELADERGWKVTQNVVTGLAGFVVPVLWFGMDWKGAVDKDGRRVAGASTISDHARRTALPARLSTAPAACTGLCGAAAGLCAAASAVILSGAIVAMRRPSSK